MAAAEDKAARADEASCTKRWVGGWVGGWGVKEAIEVQLLRVFYCLHALHPGPGNHGRTCFWGLSIVAMGSLVPLGGWVGGLYMYAGFSFLRLTSWVTAAASLILGWPAPRKRLLSARLCMWVEGNGKEGVSAWVGLERPRGLVNCPRRCIPIAALRTQAAAPHGVEG